MIRPPLAVLTAVAVLSFGVVACGGDDTSTSPSDTTSPSGSIDEGTTTTTTDAATSTSAATTSTTAAAPADPGTPDGFPVRQTLDDVVVWLNDGTIDEADYHGRFADSFVAEIPYDDFDALLLQLNEQGPWELVGEPVEQVGTLSNEIHDGQGGRYTLWLGLDAVEDPDGGDIELLFFEALFDAPESPEDALRQLGEFGTLRFVEARVDGDDCRAVGSVGAVDPDDAMPLGSTFKLYVLGAVVDAVEAGTIDWDTAVVVRDELRSIPAGVTQDEPAGTELTVEELATRMIAISDNTATDLLIDLVGRDDVEAALTDHGHADPGVTVPLLTTRELTILKFADDDLAERYVAATIDERRAILDDEVAAAELPPLEAITPAGVATADTIEWFASPLDLCRAFARLAQSDAALDILAVNPGVPAEAGRWAYIGFKGGSSPGVLATAWLVEDDDGVRTVVAGGVANTTTLVPDVAAIDAFAFLRDAASS